MATAAAANDETAPPELDESLVEAVAEGRLSAALEGALDDVEGAAPKKGANGRRVAGLIGLPTGFRDLDTLTSGLMNGSLTVIASRPGAGRTTLMLDICRHTAIDHGTPTLVYTFEESERQLGMRVASAESRVAMHRMRSGRMADEDWVRLARRMPETSAAPMFVRAPAHLTMAELAEEARTTKEKHGIRLLAVDGIQDIRPEKRSDLREREVGDVVRDLKTLARELQIPIVATSHLNRGAEQRPDRRPELDDLRESGAITYAADMIILLHRPDMYSREERPGEADLIVSKHRQGPTATMTVAFQGHYARFVDMAGDI